MPESQNGRGRPRLPDDQAARESIRVRMTSDELNRIRSGAAIAGETVSAFVRRLALGEAERLER